ncbi:sialate O-acetylesterase [Thermoflavifilum thermophilum]|uniref:Sialate O-acetylesterase n=1 Tax=Thermoflavifilum thermophilum TaxID=1393122 RepID=A0A1I7NIV4_9BACT|nr:sialate O-acetylesterase [Thermoflavifilum thermophilum]SFV34597.1 sialate O-acetylesterase [Thermoflavifilum thermophilum]
MKRSCCHHLLRNLLTIHVMILSFSWHAWGYVDLPDIISDSMVLQQNQPIPIWGRALPGEEVIVRFKNQVKTTIADDQGHWYIVLNPMQADSVAADMWIEGINTIHLKGILVGEVWLCAGQSNMQLTLSESLHGDSAVTSAHDPQLRLFNVNRITSFGHQYGPIGQWQASYPASVRVFSAVAYYYGQLLRQKLHVPVGIINDSYGGSQAEAWTPVAYLHTPDLQPCIDREKTWAAERAIVQHQYQQAITQWKLYAEQERAAGRVPREAPHQPDALREYRPAGSIYEHMVKPLIPFAIRGVIWYQGESNEDRAEQYGILLPTLIRSWRNEWHNDTLPFGIIQLPNFRDPHPYPADEAWSHLRDAQRWTADTVPHCGLIVTIDLGEAHNIHPKDKWDVSKRVLQWALAKVYDWPVLPGGPIFQQAHPNGNKMILTFTCTGKGLKTTDGMPPNEFALAGEDHQWHWAKAKILSPNQIIVWSPEVKHPIAVRYAFNNNPLRPNLTNDSGIPASPFRSDDWPGPTHGKR